MASAGSPNREHLPRGLYTFHPMVVERGRGCRVTSEEGLEFLDLTSGLAVLALGHGDPRLAAAMEAQLRKLTHMCGHVAIHRPYLALARRLAQSAPITGTCETFLTNSGAEAVENAVRIARYATRRRMVLAFDGGYHGRTLLGATLTSRATPYRRGLSPMATEIRHVPYAYCYRCPWDLGEPECRLRCLDALERFFLLECPPDEVAAILVEPIQGEGGVVVPPDGFLRRLRQVCTAQGILLIADEVQSGLGRTGSIFAVQASGVEPDLLVLGKALGAGLPLAAVVGRTELMEAPHTSALGSTFGGNPVACAGGLALLDILEQDALCARAQEIWVRFCRRSQDWTSRFPWVGDLRGRGAMIGMELVRDRQTKEPAVSEARRLVRSCFRKGLVLVSGGLHRNVLRLLPPLTISWEDLDRALDILEETLAELS